MVIHCSLPVISCETGEVLDFEIMSRHCSICKLHKSRLSPEEFHEWFLEHKNSKQYHKNYEGSSGSTQRAAILIIFKRSRNSDTLHC